MSTPTPPAAAAASSSISSSSSPTVQHLLSVKAERQQQRQSAAAQAGGGDNSKVGANVFVPSRQQQQGEEEPEQIVYAEAVEPTTTTAPSPTGKNAVATPTENNARDDLSPESCDCLLCGDTRIRGSRVRVGRNTFVSLCGDTVIDMRETRFPAQQPAAEPSSALPPQFHFIVVRLCGNVRLLVPRGTRFTLRRTALCGNRTVEIDDADDDDDDGHVVMEAGGGGPAPPPAVKLTLVTLCGDVRVEN